jgi:hypothetical protein
MLSTGCVPSWSIRPRSVSALALTAVTRRCTSAHAGTHSLFHDELPSLLC